MSFRIKVCAIVTSLFGSPAANGSILAQWETKSACWKTHLPRREAVNDPVCQEQQMGDKTWHIKVFKNDFSTPPFFYSTPTPPISPIYFWLSWWQLGGLSPRALSETIFYCLGSFSLSLCTIACQMLNQGSSFPIFTVNNPTDSQSEVVRAERQDRARHLQRYVWLWENWAVRLISLVVNQCPSYQIIKKPLPREEGGPVSAQISSQARAFKLMVQVSFQKCHLSTGINRKLILILTTEKKRNSASFQLLYNMQF